MTETPAPIGPVPEPVPEPASEQAPEPAPEQAPEPAPEPDSLGELLAAAVRPEGPDADGESRALAAFRSARDAGALDAAPRRRDDWRPRRRGRWSLRATVGAVLAGLTMGGVAIAGIGGPGAEPVRPQPPGSTATPSAPPSTPPVVRDGTAVPAHEKSGKGGKGETKREEKSQKQREKLSEKSDKEREKEREKESEKREKQSAKDAAKDAKDGAKQLEGGAE
ncbi:hypothetical protein AB0J38_40060 [Streptomyces sp. NPDC050095]|uniref:hypothetical protein n=1 Tax=unclassified Streptomyces TaxID=2593676 RepID=UPI00343CD10B